jgi:hypothetical protein
MAPSCTRARRALRRARWRRLRPAIDALDFVVIVAEWRRGAVPGPAGLVAGTAPVATALGSVSALAEAARPTG